MSALVTSRRPVRRRLRRTVSVLVASALGVGLLVVSAPAQAATNRVDLRVLVVTDRSVMVDALVAQLDIEGVPHTDVPLADPGRATITPDFLSSGTEANYQAVILPQSSGAAWTSGVTGLSGAEMSALSAYETTFGVRQVDADETPGPQVGLTSYQGQTSQTWAGGLDGFTATATPAARASNWGYLNGPVPVTAGTYAILSTPLTATSTPALPAGATFTPLVTVPIPGQGTSGTLVGAYADGVEQLVITGAFSAAQQHFRMIAHGIVGWMTRGIHFGYNRNFYSQQFDDAFSYDSRWNAQYNCTPGEDCAAALNVPASDIRMTAADVSHLVSWQTANDYQPTLAFNGYYSQFDANGNPWNGQDPLTNAFVANKTSIRWLNHGYEHIFQGCQQDFTTLPWHCVTTDGQPPAADGSNIVWVPQAAISREISTNIAVGTTLGLPFDKSEYLSGEHSGLYLTPQQPVDNPNFGAVLTANGITSIGADASREPAPRQVGSATTVPRHPVAVYYNVSTQADEVDEYNWIYLSSSNGGSGYCDANPATATCLPAALDPATGFHDYILPTDVANDLGFILSNDPRPFYAHVANLTGLDYLGLSLMSSILSTYRAAYTTSAPLLNLTLTQAAAQLGYQSAWASTGMTAGSAVSGYVQDGLVTISNPTTAAAPVTVPVGTTVVGGAAFGSAYGGESSAWVSGSTTLAAPVPAFTSPSSASVKVGVAATVPVVASGAQTVTETGALPSGMLFSDNGNGRATLTGTPTAGTGGSYPLTFTATNEFGTTVQAFTLTVVEKLSITSPRTATFTTSTPGSFTITAVGSPVPLVALVGILPQGLTFSATGGGQATLSGTPGAGAGGQYPVSVTATNAAGAVTQSLTIVVQQPPAFTSADTATLTVGKSRTTILKTSGYPAPVVALTGALPQGLTFTPRSGGSAVIKGTPAAGTAGTYPLTLTATNAAGTATQAFTLTVQAAPTLTTPSSVTVTANTAFSIGVTAVGTPTPTVSLRSRLPSDVTFTAQPDGTATLSGILGTSGSLTVRLRATSSGGTANQSLVITVA